MLMDAGLDTGPVLSQEAAAISDSDTTGSLTAALAGLGARLLVETIDGWLAGSVVPRVQNEREATYSGKVGVEDGLLDWTQPATVLSRRVRAYNPWPGCHTFWEGQRLKVHSAVPLALRPHGEPGRVVQLPGPVPTRIGVVTAQGVLGLGASSLKGNERFPLRSSFEDTGNSSGRCWVASRRRTGRDDRRQGDGATCSGTFHTWPAAVAQPTGDGAGHDAVRG